MISIEGLLTLVHTEAVTGVTFGECRDYQRNLAPESSCLDSPENRDYHQPTLETDEDREILPPIRYND